VRGPDSALEDDFIEGRCRMIEDGKMEISRAIKGSSSELNKIDTRAEQDQKQNNMLLYKESAITR
jgi:hypothetical protein